MNEIRIMNYVSYRLCRICGVQSDVARREEIQNLLTELSTAARACSAVPNYILNDVVQTLFEIPENV